MNDLGSTKGVCRVGGHVVHLTCSRCGIRTLYVDVLLYLGHKLRWFEEIEDPRIHQETYEHVYWYA